MAALDDAARRWTDSELEALEKRMAREYSQAAREMRGKQAKWLEKFNREREQRERALDSTKEAMEAHKRWLQSQAARGDWLDGMATQLAQSAHQANVRAMEMVNGHVPRVFSENANRAAFSVDKMLGADTGFTLVNEEAVRHVMEAGVFDTQLIREVVPDAPELGPAAIQSLRRREVDYPRDMRWNRQKFTSAITQGILQGESIPNIVKRTESIYGQNRNAAIRAARTATTNAENAGRMNSFERAQKLGIDMEIEWQATLDDRTRETHRMLDGERIQLGEYFETENGPIRWPGDPMADPADTWNCRCRADGRVAGFDGKRGDWADDEAGERWSRLPEGTTYEQWKAGKAVSRAESYENEAGRVSGAWYAERAADALSMSQAANSIGFAVDSLHPEKVGGVERASEAMTFDDANGLRGNPKYAMHEEAADAVKELEAEYREASESMSLREWLSSAKRVELSDKLKEARSRYEHALAERKPYTVNCQTCVVANEARRRGYDVMATGNVRGSVNERVSYNTNLAWIDPKTGKNPEYIRYNGKGAEDFRGRPIPTRTSYWKWLESDGVVEEGNRYTIEFWWKGRSSTGHIVSLERVDGELRMYDPQNGRVFRGAEVKEYLGDVKYSRTSYGMKYAEGPELLRVDNMEFNTEITDAILEART